MAGHLLQFRVGRLALIWPATSTIKQTNKQTNKLAGRQAGRLPCCIGRSEGSPWKCPVDQKQLAGKTMQLAVVVTEESGVICR